MQSDNSPELLADDSAAARRVGTVLVVLAALALGGNCLLNSPGRFSEAHAQDTSLLKPIVTALGLGGQYPTIRGIEIRNLLFYLGAGLLSLVGGVRLLTSGRCPRLSGNDLLDVRNRASSPVFWWFLLLLASVLSSMFATAPDLSKNQSIVRFIHFAWWLPLALLLAARDVRRLATSLVLILGMTAGIGIWYFFSRNAPGTRLIYPIGNQLWLAACLLPGVFIAFGLGVERLRMSANGPSGGEETSDLRHTCSSTMLFNVVMLLAIGAMVVAIFLTRARSSAAGFVAGVFVFAFVLLGKTGRRLVLVVALLLATGGVGWLQYTRTYGEMGHRAHSIRERLNYEWPYAVTLFTVKPILGHGEGGYARLAGQFAREDQLDDPGTISFDQRSWIAQAHNEILELLADLGIVGALSFVAALGLPVFYAVRCCTRRETDAGELVREGIPDSVASCSPSGMGMAPKVPEAHDAPGSRWLVAGLAAGLVAMAVEECGGNALRQPGLPAIFMTVWALLWAMVRTVRVAKVSSPEDQWLGASSLRIAGVVAVAVAGFVGYYGVQDWQAARARYEADRLLKDDRPAEAIVLGNFAERHTLDTFQNLTARMRVVQAHHARFVQILQSVSADRPLTPEDFEVAQMGIARLNTLRHAAPRFLQVAQLDARLSEILAQTFAAVGRTDYASEFQKRAVAAWERHRMDEPFSPEAVTALWARKPSASAKDRLDWLRGLLRNGEFDARVVTMLHDLARRDDFAATLDDLYNVACADEERDADSWQDRLSPETLRLAALAKFELTGLPAEAAKLCGRAATMYSVAGPRLFAGRSAALHEQVRYALAHDPTAQTDKNLERLADAFSGFWGAVDASKPLSGSMGWSRLMVLLAAEREQAAKSQIKILATEKDTPISRSLAEAYLTMAAQFSSSGRHLDFSEKWAKRAVELAPELLGPWQVLTHIYLHHGDDKAAFAAANKSLSLIPVGGAMATPGDSLNESADPTVTSENAADGFLLALERRYPGSGIWALLRAEHPHFPAPIEVEAGEEAAASEN